MWPEAGSKNLIIFSIKSGKDIWNLTGNEGKNYAKAERFWGNKWVWSRAVCDKWAWSMMNMKQAEDSKQRQMTIGVRVLCWALFEASVVWEANGWWGSATYTFLTNMKQVAGG